MTKEREALKLALEALKELVAQTEGRYFCMKHDHVALQNARHAIARAREALAPIEIERELALQALHDENERLGLYEDAYGAQPEQEPVSIPDCGEAGHADGACGNRECLPSFRRNTTPPQRKPQIWEHEGYDALCQELELWKAEAQRKPLSNNEIRAILDDPNIAERHEGNWLVLPYTFARAIEAAHQIKENT